MTNMGGQEMKTKRKLDALLALSDQPDENHNKKSRLLQENIANSSKSFENKTKKVAELLKSGGAPNSRKFDKSKKNKNGSITDKNKKISEGAVSSQKKSPKIELKGHGKAALLSNLKEARIPLQVADLQSLLAFSLLGNMAPYRPFRFCELERPGSISTVLCVVLEGVGVDHFDQLEDAGDGEVEGGADFPWIRSNLDLAEVVSPASYEGDIPQELGLVQASKHMLFNLVPKYGSMEAVKKHLETKRTVKTTYSVAPQTTSDTQKDERLGKKLELILNVDQMRQEGFILPVSGKENKYEDFVNTKDKYKEVSEDSPLIAVDCEFCRTKNGQELAYICLITEKLEVLYKSYVQPSDPVLDYQTIYSGVTKEHLRGVTTSLSDVQAAVRQLLPSDCILVGHSLNSDLKVMQMMHPYVMDTSVMYNLSGHRRHKSKLRELSSIFLRKEIQAEETGTEFGHCPEEDAIATMELALLKLNKGLAFGDARFAQNGSQDYSAQLGIEEKKVVEEIASITLTSLAKRGKKSLCVVVSKSLEESYNKIPSFVFEAKLFQTGEYYKSVIAKTKRSMTRHNMIISHCDLTSCAKLSTAADTICSQLYDSLPKNCLFVVIFAGSKDSNAAAAIKISKS
eukprot:TRINITY_DN20754_c0_g1_i5.p1 TRINITY_DN20754_c0_g1~~TRINITY_DN20754_c0_g1_i5.p1  ORF type:complete len:626 (-),score=150.86 TRINITY_DN20754_c0_g1_i5:35-1912(-)